MTQSPSEPAIVVAPAPRRSPLVMVWILLLGVVMGASCVTCAQTSLDVAGDRVYGSGDERVGVVELLGPIMEVDEVVRQIRRFGDREDLRAVILRIDSPGGAVAPSQEVYDALRAVSDRKPVVASMGSVAASGGFWVSLGADWVVADPGTITGSIGVITQSPDLRGLAERIDFRMRTFKSGPVKDLGNPLRELTERDEEVFMGLIDDIYDQFVDLTAERRGLDQATVRRLADGQIFTGRRAFQEGLVDELGGLHRAAHRALFLALERKGELAAGTSTSTMDGVEEPALVYPRGPTPPFLELLLESVGDGIGRGLAKGLGFGPGGLDSAPPALLR